MSPILQQQKQRQPQVNDLEVMKKQVTPQLLKQMIARAKQQGISETDISAGLKMLGIN